MWTPDEVAERARRRRRAAERPASGTSITDGRQLRGPLDPQPPAPPRASWTGRPPSRTPRRRLFAAREQRPRPGLDDKVLTEWNALMLASLAEAAALFGRADWIAAAVANGEFLLRRAPRRRPAAGIARWQADGDPPARHAALAADHAAARSMRSPGSPRPPARRAGSTRPRAVADMLLDHFWDVDHGGLFTTADDGEALLVRQKDLLDNATPSANSTAAPGPVPPRRAHRRQPLRQPRRPDPAAARRGDRPGAVGVLPRAGGGRPAPRRHRPRSPSSATDPTCWPSSTSAGGRTPWSPGASRTTPRCGKRGSTATPTSAATTPARPRRPPPTVCAPNSPDRRGF